MKKTIIRVYVDADTSVDEEVKAIQVLYRAIQDHPQSYPLLHVQADFLRSKVGGFHWARDSHDTDDSERPRASRNGHTSWRSKPSTAHLPSL